MEKEIVAIAGAGPAGLTAAIELLDRSERFVPALFEESDMVGGISRTINHNGNRIDIGGHRFFSKSERVNSWWQRLMPLQGKPASDDIRLGIERPLADDGPDPQIANEVMLVRRRVSRILYGGKFFAYPISPSLSTFAKLGLRRTVKVGVGYLRSVLAPRSELSLEDFYINRFGKPLYEMFFENYTEKVWGQHPSRLGADWGSQRVKGLSVTALLRDMICRGLNLRQRQVETSLIEQFSYPKYGPGQMWEAAANAVEARGGNVKLNTRVERVNIGTDGRVESVDVARPDGNISNVRCDFFISSMPLKDLVASISGIDVPAEVIEAAAGLPYRDFITVGILVKDLKVKNKTKVPTIARRIPDTWIYVQEPAVKMGRIQIFNNWSPYMVADAEGTTWIGLEYFCNEGDEMWRMTDGDFIDMAVDELIEIGMIDSAADVLDSVRIKMKKAYPAYFGTYADLGVVRDFLDSIPNLYCVGRNGQHRYNNMDHSMLTAMTAADAIIDGSADKSAIWSVNTENSYHETK